VFYDARVEAQKERKDLLPHSSAQKTRVGVGRIVAVRNAMAPQMGFDVALASAKHGADSIPVAGRKHRQTSHAGSTQEPHHEGLGAIISVVAGGDSIGALPRRRLTKSNPTCRSRTGLQIAAGGDGNIGPAERDVQRSGKGFRHVEFCRAPGA
jgi:hypothetical protein